MILSHKIELKPTKEQIIQFEKACGCARFAYNWRIK
jgi:transposase